MKWKALAILLAVLITNDIEAQKPKVTKHENVIYGMISGMALLMDVYEPENANNIGIVFISGSAFGYWDDYQKIYNQVPLKDDYTLSKNYVGKWAQELVNKGYTVFMINHRFSPRFKYPDAVEDCRRAVRFIRYNASKYKINPNKIGAMGHSSGAYLSSMLGVLDNLYPNPDKNPIDSVNSKVQAVVSLAAPYVLSDINAKSDANQENNLSLLVDLSYMGELPNVVNGEFTLSGKYAEASPITHVSKGDAPILIYTSDDDPLIHSRQASAMYKKLMDSDVETKLMMDPKSGHGPKPDMNEVDKWFKKYLR